MQSEELLELTASEPLSMKEEQDMQREPGAWIGHVGAQAD